MRKLFSIFMVTVLLMITGCSSHNKIQNQDMYFYFGQSDSWIATYSITKAKSSYYNSLVMQSLFEENETMTKIGPIEYELTGTSIKTQSSCPQGLQACASLHVPGRVNLDVFDINIDEDIELIIKWQDKSETIKLKIQY